MRAFFVLALLALCACGHAAPVVGACDTPFCNEPSDLASAPQPSEGHKLIPITIDSGVDIDSVRVRGDTVVVRTTRRPHCGGTPPAGPMSVRIEVPNNAEHVVLKSRRRGRCKNRRGPPPV